MDKRKVPEQVRYHEPTLRKKRAFSRAMRDAPTPAEERLRHPLRRLKRDGIEFKRQSMVLGWIPDFYCPDAELVVEVDGGMHDKEADSHRDKTMAEVGIFTMRFSNRDVLTDLDAVVEKVREVALSRLR